MLFAEDLDLTNSQKVRNHHFLSFSDLSENPDNSNTSGCRIKSPQTTTGQAGMTVLGRFTRPSDLIEKGELGTLKKDIAEIERMLKALIKSL